MKFYAVLAAVDINGKQADTPADIVTASFINLQDELRRRHPDAEYRFQVVRGDDHWSIEAVAIDAGMTRAVAKAAIPGPQLSTPPDELAAIVKQLHAQMQRTLPESGTYRLRVRHQDKGWVIEAVADGD